MDTIIASQDAAVGPTKNETLGVPDGLRARPQWLCWRWVVRNGKRTKVPYDPKTGGRADPTEPADWSTYDTAAAYAATRSDVAGVGFVFTEDDPYCGVDLDDCRDPNSGELTPEAAQIVADFDTYAEVSPSGTGVKLFLQGVIPGDRNRTGNVEVYDSGRFFTVTGQHLTGTPLAVNARQKQLTRLYGDVFGADEPTAATDLPPATGLADGDVIDAALDEDGGKFARLYYRGDVSSYQDGDDSVADFALASMLGKHTGGDVEQVARLMRASALNRDKYNRKDYLPRTVMAALKASQASHSLIRTGSLGNLKNDLQAISFSTSGRPGPTLWTVKNAIPQGHASIIYGAGGEGKSFTVMDLATAVADPGSTEWLGLEIQTAPVLYLDFELDWEVQARRAFDLAAGRGLSQPPDDLLYMSALGFRTGVAIHKAADAVRQHGVKLVILDSIGPAMQGDAESSTDVIGFYRDHIDPLREMGVTVVIVDHESKLVKGERRIDKSPFGSVYKRNLSRSVIQVRGDWNGSVLTATLRHDKTNFGPKLDPITAQLTFGSDMIEVRRVDTPVEVRVHDAPTAPDKVLEALKGGPMYPDALAEATGMALKTVQNRVSDLRKSGRVVNTGNKKGQASEVQLSQPSHPIKGTGRLGIVPPSDTVPDDPDSILIEERQD